MYKVYAYAQKNMANVTTMSVTGLMYALHL